jgi:hypothetical protein
MASKLRRIAADRLENTFEVYKRIDLGAITQAESSMTNIATKIVARIAVDTLATGPRRARAKASSFWAETSLGQVLLGCLLQSQYEPLDSSLLKSEAQ